MSRKKLYVNAENHHNYGLQCVRPSSPCLSCNFWANEDKIKILSSWYLVWLRDVVLDVINFEIVVGYYFCTSVKNLSSKYKIHIRLIPNAQREFCHSPYIEILLLEGYQAFDKNIMSFRVKHVRPWVQYVLIEHNGNETQISQIWLWTSKKAKNYSYHHF